MAPQKITILIVDDSSDSSDITAAQISAYLPEAVILTAPDGAEGLKLLRSKSIDVVITDEVMPKKSGTDLIKEATLAGINCPFIILTGLRVQDVSIEKRQAHRIRILEKPATGPDLLHLIDSVLSGRKSA